MLAAMAPRMTPAPARWDEPVGWLVALCGALGIVLGLVLTRWLERRPYRLEEERGRPAQPVGWWIVPACGVLWALIAWRLGDVGHGLALPPYLGLASVGLALTAIDLDVHRLPDPIVLPAVPVLFVLLVLASAGTGEWGALLRAVLAGVVLLVGYFVLAFVSPGGGGLGLGDVKLAGLLGLALGWLGWGEVLVGALAGFVVGGLVVTVLLIARRVGRKSFVAFGPFMIVGALVGVLVPVQVVAGSLAG